MPAARLEPGLTEPARPAVAAYEVVGVALDASGRRTAALLTFSPTGELLAARTADGNPGPGPVHALPERFNP